MRIKSLKIDNQILISPIRIKQVLAYNGFSWVNSSEIENAILEIKDNKLIWHSGIWYYGITGENLIWYNGIFRGGEWNGSLWVNGFFDGGVFNSGKFEAGKVSGGLIKKEADFSGEADMRFLQNQIDSNAKDDK